MSHRIYFDGNNRLEMNVYDLGLPKSQEDMARIAGGPREGMRVVIYMTGELEMAATLVFDKTSKRWGAKAIAGTTTYY